MGNQEIDVNILIQEYDATIAAIISENTRLKAMIKTLEKKSTENNDAA